MNGLPILLAKFPGMEDYSRRRRKAQAPVPTDVSILLKGLMDHSVLGERSEAAVLIQNWEKVVGARVAVHLQVLDIQGDTLLLRASSGPWQSEANLQKKAIIEGCNALLGKVRLRELRFA